MSKMSNMTNASTSSAKWRSQMHRKLSLVRNAEEDGEEVPVMLRACMSAVGNCRESSFGTIFFNRKGFFSTANRQLSTFSAQREIRNKPMRSRILSRQGSSLGGPVPRKARSKISGPKFDCGSETASYISFSFFIKSWFFFAPVVLFQAVYGVVRLKKNLKHISGT